MNNGRGYIRIWELLYQTGVIFGCEGAADGQNLAFRFANINDHTLQQELASRQDFQLDRNCKLQPPGTIWVTYYDDGNGFALNILPS